MLHLKAQISHTEIFQIECYISKERLGGKKRKDFLKAFRTITSAQGSLLLWKRINPFCQKRFLFKSVPENFQTDTCQPLKNTV